MRLATKTLIWIYIILLIFEGSLRKWILPSLAEPLLIVRDPIVVAIYSIALIQGFFPSNKWVMAVLVLALASTIVSFLGGLSNVLIIAYGLRIDYGHLPLIWIIAEVFELKDLRWVGLFFCCTMIAMCFIMVEQFRSPQDAWINKGIGADEGGQIFGAEGKIRPPGFFAFITGPQIFLPVCLAFILDYFTKYRDKWLPVVVAAGLAVLIATPVSISRTVMMANVIVVLTFLCCTPFINTSVSKLIKPMLLIGIVVMIASQLDIFQEGMRVFGVRWETAAGGDEVDGLWDVIGRTMQTFTNPFTYAAEAPLIGSGIGMGSNVASHLLSGQMGFMLAEEEYAKIYLELGLVVGTGFILLRVILTGHLLVVSIRALREQRKVLPLLLFSAASTIILFGQWAPPTVLGFSVLSAGLIYCSIKKDPETEAAGASPTTGTATAAVTAAGSRAASHSAPAPMPTKNNLRLPFQKKVEKRMDERGPAQERRNPK